MKNLLKRIPLLERITVAIGWIVGVLTAFAIFPKRNVLTTGDVHGTERIGIMLLGAFLGYLIGHFLIPKSLELVFPKKDPWENIKGRPTKNAADTIASSLGQKNST